MSIMLLTPVTLMRRIASAGAGISRRATQHKARVGLCRCKRQQSSLHQQQPVRSPAVQSLFAGIKEGNRGSLSRGITLVESTRSDHREQARELVAAC
ncbi:hypothetical protein GGH99_003663, partial [Coemansia sp. RSA 1285]